MAKDINIKIKADGSDASKGIKQVQSDLNKFSKNGINQTVKDVSKLSKTIKGLGITAVATTSIAAIKKVCDGIKETTDLYNTQIKAEQQLATAAKNNPYLNDSSVQALKNYASQLQSISTVGDEELLPFMAQLASAGRTQEEIQQIMSAALDVSASGMMSLDSAVTSLNKTYSGSVGLLGNQIDGLKDLTKEQLKNGDAVKIVADKFKGMAEETAKATGSQQQLKNAIGDLKEEFGATFEKGLGPVRRFFTELISGWANAKKAKREYEESEKKVKDGNGTTADYEKILAEETKKLNEYQGQVERWIDILNDDKKLQEAIEKSDFLYDKSTFQDALITAQKNYELQQQKVNALKSEHDAQKKLEEAEAAAIAKEKELAEQKKASAEEAEKKADKDRQALEFMKKNQDELDKTIEKLKIEASLKGEEVNQQDILNAMMKSYIDLVTGSDLVSENNPFSKKRLEELQKYAAQIGGVTEEVKTLTNEMSDAEKEAEELAKKIQELRENTANQLKIVNDYAKQFGDVTQDMVNMINNNTEKATDTQLKNLERMYNEGLMTEEQFLAEKERIEKESAQKSYEVEMFNWHSQILEASANIAAACAASLADQSATTAQRIINMALIASTGAAQIATLTANKPIPPSFATGGIVGATMGADDTIANVHTSEMILNANQQKELWEIANGKGAGGSINMPITIENNANANVGTQINEDGLRIVIDKMVTTSMREGKYNGAMVQAQQKQRGIKYL